MKEDEYKPGQELFYAEKVIVIENNSDEDVIKYKLKNIQTGREFICIKSRKDDDRFRLTNKL